MVDVEGSNLISNYIHFYMYGITTGIIVAAGLFALFFSIKKFVVDQSTHVGSTFFYGAIAFLSFALFNTYSLATHFPLVAQVFPEWVFYICKLAIPIGLFTNFRMLTHAIPVKNAETFLFWQRSKKYQYLVYLVYLTAFLALASVINEVKWVMTVCFGLAILHCILSTVFSIFTIKSREAIQIHSLVLIVLGVSFASLLILIWTHDLTLISNVWFIIIHMLLAALILACSFSLISYIVDVAAPQQSNEKFSIDSFEKNIYHGLKNKEFYLEYQPKINLDDKTVYGLEALVRWQHPKKGFISPADFIPMAENTHVINDICKYIIDMSIQDALRLQQENIYLDMSINFSVKNINMNVAKYLVEQLDQYKIDTHMFTVEITESLFLSMETQQRKALYYLYANNIKLSLDDFGAGFSSLQHIDELQLNEIKLDRSITEKISDEGKSSVVENVIKLCQDLGIHVVAEGVNSLETSAALLNMGCNKAQGFGISKPRDLENFIAWHKNIITVDIQSKA